MRLLKLNIYILLLAFIGFSCSEDPDAPTPPGQETPDATKTIKDLKALVTGDDAYEIPADYVIKAVVLSNQGESNNFYRSLFIQDDETAIKISCEKESLYETLKQGQEVTLVAEGLYVAKSYDTYVIGSAASDDNYKVTIISPDKLSKVLIAGDEDQTFKTTEITDLSKLSADMVGSWVKISNVQVVESQIGSVLADGTTSYGTVNMTDANGVTFQISTNQYANFADFTMPEGSGSISGILGTYSTNFQVTLTSTADLDLTGERFEVNNPNAGDNDVCGSDESPIDGIFETFTDATNNADYEETGWLNVIEQGERRWQGKYYDGDNNYYVQATAHNAAEGTHSMWLITPPLNVDNATSKILRFKSAQAYYQASTTLEVFVLQCINNETVETKLEPILANPDNQANYEFVSSGDIDLSSYSGIVHIGFHYTGQGGSGNSTTWCIDDVEFNNTTTAVEFASSPETVVDGDTEYSYAISTSISNPAGTTVITATGLPAWLSLVDNGDGTATLAGTAPAVSENETHNIVITATNNGITANQEFSLLVKAPVAPGSNLVINGSFEDWAGDLPTGWDNASYNTNMTLETGIVYDGNNSVKHTAGTSKIQQEVDVTGGSTYTITYRFLDNDANARSRMWSYWTDGSSTIDANTVELRPSTYSDDNSDWQTVSYTLVAPANAAKLRFEVRTYNTGDGGGVVYYDDFSVVEQ